LCACHASITPMCAKRPVSSLASASTRQSAIRCQAQSNSEASGESMGERPTHLAPRAASPRVNDSSSPSVERKPNELTAGSLCWRLVTCPSEMDYRAPPVRAPRSHSFNFDHRRRPETLRTAMATAFF
jgi:hypothetical protein